MAKNVKDLGRALRQLVSPKAWAERDADERAKIRADFEKAARKLPPISEKTLRHLPRVRKFYLGGK